MSSTRIAGALATVLTVVVSACDAATSTPSASPTRHVPTQTEGTVPYDLRAAWKTTLTATNETITLTLTDRTYLIKRGLVAGNGNVEAHGDQIVFSSSPLCDGAGTYRWSLQGAALRFTQVTPDACGQRSEVLEGQTYRHE